MADILQTARRHALALRQLALFAEDVGPSVAMGMREAATWIDTTFHTDEPIGYTSQAQIDKVKDNPGANFIIWGEPLPYHDDIPLFPHPQVKVTPKEVYDILMKPFMTGDDGDMRGGLMSQAVEITELLNKR